MEALKQIIKIPKNREIKIKIPENIPVNETTELIIFFRKIDSYNEKLEKLKKCKRDELFTKDIQDTMEDFKFSDLELEL